MAMAIHSKCTLPTETLPTHRAQLEGLFTISVGLIFIGLFPKSPSHSVSLLGRRYFNEREAQILSQRILKDDPSKAKEGRSVSKKELVDVVWHS